MKRVTARGKAFVFVTLVGCVAVEVVEQTSVDTAELADGQGTNAQGTNAQGTNAQGTNAQDTKYNEADWLYTSLANVTWGSTPVENAEISKGSLIFWRPKKKLVGNTWSITGWERRAPNEICHYDANKNLDYCTTLSSFSTSNPSPIAGARFPARFRDADGVEFDTTILIGAGTADASAVAFNTSSAMHVLGGTGVTTCGTTYGNGAIMADGSKCESPNGCRQNCDLWRYKIFIVDPELDGGTPRAVCGGSGYALAVPGVYAKNGERTNGPMVRGKHTQFTFACMSGTIAKCTQWGYRPWGTATKTCQTEPCGAAPAAVPLVDLHQSCVRAAMADYCVAGVSFTRQGTLVDVWDYEHRVAGQWGLVARTRAPNTANDGAFVFESTFDKHGFYFLDHARYEEASSGPVGSWPTGCNMAPVCYPGGACDGTDGWRRISNELTQPDPASMINIDSTTACAHSEFMTGKWLHEDCSSCTQRIADTPGYEHCTTPVYWSPINPGEGGWDVSCVERARQYCAAEDYSILDGPYSNFWATQMAPHHECEVGGKLSRLDTGCTAAVCGAYSSCCTTSWSESCIAVANAVCRGGRETDTLGFCGLPD